jgi:hypothetical protein
MPEQAGPQACKANSPTGCARIAAEASTRASRFMRRIDAHLPTLPDDRARRLFLARQLDEWQRRYARFLVNGGASATGDGAEPPHAADFLLTIAALARRHSALAAGKRGAIRMSETPMHPRLERAMRSLLVAADQRCPAIIGGAHLLYHGRADRQQWSAERALTQLRNDAQDLLAAIVAAETDVKAAGGLTTRAD